MSTRTFSKKVGPVHSCTESPDKQDLKGEFDGWQSKKRITEAERDQKIVRGRKRVGEEGGDLDMSFRDRDADSWAEWTSKRHTNPFTPATDVTFREVPSEDFAGMTRRRRLDHGDSMAGILSPGPRSRSTPRLPVAPSAAAGAEPRPMPVVGEDARVMRRPLPDYEARLGGQEERATIGKRCGAQMRDFARVETPVTSVFYEQNARPAPWAGHGDVISWQE